LDIIEIILWTVISNTIIYNIMLSWQKLNVTVALADT